MLAGVTKNSSRGIFTGNRSLGVVDPLVYALNRAEIKRQFECLELIASENFASHATLSAISSHFNNKYSEGYPGARYYAGTEIVDDLERLCQERALAAFNLSPETWGVNVQSLSGSPANFAVYTALIPPNGRMMGLALADGGHLTHGFRNKFKPVSASSRFWQSLPYTVDRKTSLIDYAGLERNARLFNPHLIIAGGSAYPRNIDYARMRTIADSTGSVLMADMAHVAGLVAAGLSPSPFEFCDVVTTTTHKTLRSVRGALIFFRRGERMVGKKTVKYSLEKEINSAVFPGLQGGPHMHQIAAIAVSMKEAATPEFREYQQQVIANMRVMADTLVKGGLPLVTGGTDNHMALIDLRSVDIDGGRVELVLDRANITVNRNTIPGDKNVGAPRGVRIGSPALTTRGFLESDFRQVGKFLCEGVQHAKRLQKQTGKDLGAFKMSMRKDAGIVDLGRRVVSFARQFPLPGVLNTDDVI